MVLCLLFLQDGHQGRFEVAPNPCESPARQSSASDSPPECAPAFVGENVLINNTVTYMRSVRKCFTAVVKARESTSCLA